MKDQIQSYFTFLVLIILFSSCEGENHENPSFQLVETGEIIRLPLDTLSTNTSDGLLFFPAETPLLFNVNWMQNSIQIYNLTKRRKIKELKFDFEGPNGVLDIMGIYVHNLDSIFLFNQLVSQITIIDTTGTIKSKITYQAPDGYSPAFIHNAYFKSPPRLNEGKLLVKTHTYGRLPR